MGKYFLYYGSLAFSLLCVFNNLSFYYKIITFFIYSYLAFFILFSLSLIFPVFFLLRAIFVLLFFCSSLPSSGKTRISAFSGLLQLPCLLQLSSAMYIYVLVGSWAYKNVPYEILTTQIFPTYSLSLVHAYRTGASLGACTYIPTGRKYALICEMRLILNTLHVDLKSISAITWIECAWSSKVDL